MPGTVNLVQSLWWEAAGLCTGTYCSCSANWTCCQLALSIFIFISIKESCSQAWSETLWFAVDDDEGSCERSVLNVCLCHPLQNLGDIVEEGRKGKEKIENWQMGKRGVQCVFWRQHGCCTHGLPATMATRTRLDLSIISLMGS